MVPIKNRLHTETAGLTGFREEREAATIQGISKVDRNLKIWSESSVRFSSIFEPWQAYTIGALLAVFAAITLFIVAREIWFAIHPYKRPIKNPLRKN